MCIWSQLNFGFESSNTKKGEKKWCLPLIKAAPVSSLLSLCGCFSGFLTGFRGVPVLGMDQIQMRVRVKQIQHGSSDQHLPESLTCHNILNLPLYSTKRILRDRLTKALKPDRGFSIWWWITSSRSRVLWLCKFRSSPWAQKTAILYLQYYLTSLCTRGKSVVKCEFYILSGVSRLKSKYQIYIFLFIFWGELYWTLNLTHTTA